MRYHLGPMSTKRVRVKPYHVRLFPEDVAKIKAIAAKKLLPWQTELRLLVHRALDVRTVTTDRSDL